MKRHNNSGITAYLSFPAQLALYNSVVLAVFFSCFSAQADNTPPASQNTLVNMSFDRRGIPAKIDIWNNIFGGRTTEGCEDLEVCDGKHMLNSLVCHSDSNPENGACPTLPLWSQDIAGSRSLLLTFTHSGGLKKTVTLNANKGASRAQSAWYAAAILSDTNGFSVSIPQSALNELTLPGQWDADLNMQITGWLKCANANSTGCPGPSIANWHAHITLNITDTGSQQIYFPAFRHAEPRVDLKLNHRPGTGNIRVSGSNTLDLCLYDGSNSISNQIRLLFQDEGSSAPGRAEGMFSVYRTGADKNQEANRIDYQVSIINPTTGSSQRLSNSTEIFWTDTNRRNILRQVIMPGIPGVSLCVPAPIYLVTPEFSLAGKTAGAYTGILRIIYTPSTQTGS